MTSPVTLTNFDFSNDYLIRQLTYEDLVGFLADVFLYLTLTRSAGGVSAGFISKCVSETQKVMLACYDLIQANAAAGWCTQGRFGYFTTLKNFLITIQAHYRAKKDHAVIETIRRYMHFVFSSVALCLCKTTDRDRIDIVMQAIVQAYPELREEIYLSIKPDFEDDYPELEVMLDDFRSYYPDLIDEICDVDIKIYSKVCSVIGGYFAGNDDYTELEFCGSIEQIAARA